ncbi:MAG: diacylglycerol kinase family protein [Acidimicrobiia bacterium]
MGWTAIVNPRAGRSRGRRLLPRLRAALDEAGVATHLTRDADEAGVLAGAAFDRGEGLVACGGDGTVAALAGVAAEADGPLAIVPTGAGNDFARHLGIDHRRPLDAVALLDDGAGVLTRVDLGRATAADGTHRWFTTVANTGFDADANRWANDVRWATGTPLYVLAMLRTIVAYRAQTIRVRADDTEWHGPAWLVAVGNTSRYAGGMRIAPDAQVDDGLLDVCVVGRTSRLELMARFPSVFRGTHTRADAVELLRGARVEVAPGDDRADASGLELWASGERVGPLPATVEVVPGAVRVLVPETTAAGTTRR